MTTCPLPSCAPRARQAWEFLAEHGPATIEDITLALGGSARTLRRSLSVWRSVYPGAFRIVDWTRSPRSTHQAQALYGVGSAPDAPRPPRRTDRYGHSSRRKVDTHRAPRVEIKRGAPLPSAWSYLVGYLGAGGA